MLANLLSDKGLVSRIYEILESIQKNTDFPVKSIGKDPCKHFTTEEHTLMADKHA